VAKTVEDVVALLSLSAAKRDIDIRADLPSESLTLVAREGLVRQALFSIAQNAVEASPDGATVWISAHLDGGGVHITVRDAGEGIPDEAREHVFEPFFTTKEGLKMAGLGLGLSVAKGVVEAMGGMVGFGSVPAGGTEFHLIFPLGDASEE